MKSFNANMSVIASEVTTSNRKKVRDGLLKVIQMLSTNGINNDFNLKTVLNIFDNVLCNVIGYWTTADWKEEWNLFKSYVMLISNGCNIDTFETNNVVI